MQKIEKDNPALNDQICFHCQQVAEKYLKALLQQLGLPIPRTHNLGHLLQHVLPHDATLRPLRRKLVNLTRFAVEYRYPGLSASTRQALSAVRATRLIREETRRRLGLPN